MTRLGDFLLRRSVALRESAEGQGYVEYLLIMVLVGLGVTAGLIVLAGGINGGLSGIAGGV